MLDWIELLCFIAGVWTVLKITLELFTVIKSLKSKVNYSSYGLNSWALITAPTDGLGLGFAEFLASQGFNIVLVGRNPVKLQSVSKLLQEKFPITTKFIVKDFFDSAKNPQEFFNDIKAQTRGLDISILVNNIGFGSGGKYFAVMTEEEVLHSNAMNIWPVAFLTRLYLPDMILRKSSSAIINLSSIASTFPMPGSGIYSADKSFDNLFSLIVAEEAKYLMKGKGSKIDVLSVRPGFVDTPMTKSLSFRPLLTSVNESIEPICRALGSVNYTYGHWKHTLLGLYTNLTKDIAPYAVMNETINSNIIKK
ncbi:unnamed protein product [Blepharisma stoltei]|uniref:Uncharacterized protein n=1 Tax=Blepharisma stoltei TaxID=1481888 RepID=A0AAU9K7D2_9CILI|nr:unnamed protein product [Blepharisma stoltei]